MKKLLWAGLTLALIISSCTSKPEVVKLKVELNDLENKEVVVHTMGREKSELAKANAVDGIFEVELANIDPQLVAVSVGDKMLPLFLENGNIVVTGTVEKLDSATVKGSKAHDTYLGYGDVMKPIQDENQKLMLEYRAANAAQDKAAAEKVVARYEALMEERTELTNRFIKDNASSYVAAFLVLENNRYNSDYDEVKASFDLLSTSLKDSKAYIEIAEKLEKLGSVKIGVVAPDFEMADTEGNMVKLSSLRGKYVLMDFWASWCSPCRAENPNVVKLYNQYKDKEFDIIGISLDQDKDKWLQAIKDDQLTWNHVSDLKGWKSSAGQLYQVSGIPHTVLLDKEGKIIAKNLRGDELKEKLAELLD